MTNILYRYPVVLTLAVFLTCCTSRRASTTEALDTSSPFQLAFDSITISDSAVVGPMAVAYIDIRCLFPSSPSSPVVDSLTLWTTRILADTIVRPTTAVETARKRAFIQLSSDSSEIRSILSYAERPADSRIVYHRDIDIRPIYADSSYITLQATIYDYTAGAHGSTTLLPQTFNLADGTRVSLSALLPTLSADALSDSIHKGLMRYFEVPEDNPQRLRELLFVDRDASIPMPQTQPYLTSEGVVFLYQQYEIGPYAAGMPKVTIKYNPK